jgi:acyl-CoA thioester hydrolase
LPLPFYYLNLFMRISPEEISVRLDLNINTYNIDVAGHVNNAVYIHWLEELRTKLFTEYFDLPNLLSKGIYPVVRKTEITFRKFLKLFDKPAGKMYVESFEHGIFTLNFVIELDKKISAEGKQKCVLYNLNKSCLIKGTELQNLISKSLPRIAL